MKNIIVTGGAGYIGSHTIIELLSKTNYNVISIDNFSNSNSSTYERIKKITGKEFISLDFNLCDAKKLETELNKFENISGIIHFAAFKSVPQSVSHPLMYYNNNILSLNNLLEYTIKKKIQYFIFSSSCSVYGNADSLPVTENTPIKKAQSPYGHTKQIGEEILEHFCKANPDFNCVLLRYFNPVGAHMSGLTGELPISKPDNLVPIVTQTAVGKNSLTVFGNDYQTRDGSCIRDYVHVSDIANAHVKALEYLENKRNRKNISLFNLGTGNGVSVLEAINSFEKVSGLKLNYKIGARRAGDIEAVYSDSSLAERELGWKTVYNLDDMMSSAWRWQQNLEKK